MTREDLAASAAKLAPPSAQAVAEWSEKKEAFTAELNRIMAGRPDLAQLVGPEGRAMMEQNHRNHALFLESLFKAFQPEVLVDTVLWVFRAYRSHGFRLPYWPAQLDQWLVVLKEALTVETYNEIKPFYEWMLVNQPAFAALSDSAMAGEEPAH